MKCSECAEPNANHKCSLCGAWWCEECAEHGGFQCECEPVTLDLIVPKKRKVKRTIVTKKDIQFFMYVVEKGFESEEEEKRFERIKKELLKYFGRGRK